MMDKSCHSSGDSTTTSCSSSSSNRDHNLKHLNKISHKISKPIRKPTTFNHDHDDDDHHHIQLQNQPPPQEQTQSQPQNLQQLQQQHQPPVYNINKSDFRDVVQKLTGSPAHERFSTPPPIHPPKPPSSRLQRIRPPPLAHVSNRPPPLLNNAVHSQPPLPQNAAINPYNPVNTTGGVTSGNFIINQRQLAPLSPLPPFPAVHSAAESPISAYMRFLQNSISTVDSDPKRFSALSPLAPLVSPRWNNLAQSQPPQHQQQVLPPPQSILPSPTSASVAQSQFPMPSSPLPFGWLPSPRSPYSLLSPSMLFSPTTMGQIGFQQFPLSPRLPVPSPRWKNL